MVHWRREWQTTSVFLSVRPLPLASGVGLVLPAATPGLHVGLLLPATAPNLGRGVTPLVAAPDLRLGVAPPGCLNIYPMNSTKRQNDRVLKEDPPRSVNAQNATGDQWRNNFRKNEEVEPKQEKYPVVDVTSDRSKFQCCKEQYCIGTWNVS